MSASGKSSNRMYDERRWGYEQRRHEPVRHVPAPPPQPTPVEPIDWPLVRAEAKVKLAAAARRGVRQTPRLAFALARETRRAKRFL